MKTLKLDLKKKVLIIQPEETGNINSWVTLYSKQWDFICLGSELTEDIAKEFVHIDNHTFNTDYYTDYRDENKDCRTPLQSFISAVESKGFFWLEKECDNQFCENGKVDVGYNTFLNCQVCEEAEEKTFNNPLIFVKK